MTYSKAHWRSRHMKHLRAYLDFNRHFGTKADVVWWMLHKKNGERTVRRW